MATSYTEEEMAQILQELHIAPENGKVDGREAAKILTWRAKHEYQVEYAYNATAIRQHVKVGHIAAEDIDTTNPRYSKYSYPPIFRLPLAPKRGAGRRQKVESTQEYKEAL
ncbi:MAG: hypothetical protein H0V70_30250 [Ktedonobacteraceae bacterium]|nr:hypothetical protein [Ktedonobacteraceae bacterium]